jgi:3-methylfumaryl-CoA hydratase
MLESYDIGLRKVIAHCSPTMVRRVAAMLDLEASALEEGEILPQGWHFFMLAGETKKSDLRTDGFPGLGVPIPDLGLPRLLLGGRTVTYQGDITIGSMLEQLSFIKSISEKETTSGRIAVVTICHSLRLEGAPHPAIVETQTYILMGEKTGQTTFKETTAPNITPIKAEFQKQVIPDETLLFQYSALGFNSHKIHLDKHYAQQIEGFPDLVVNGGLATLLLTEFMRTDLGIKPADIKVKHLAPLFCNRPMTLTANQTESGWQLNIYDDRNQMAVEASVMTKVKK